MSQRKLLARGQHLYLCLLCIPLLVFAGCSLGGGSTASTDPTPTTTLSLQYQTLNLGIPQKALQAPVTGPLPANQVLHVGVTFKLNSQLLKSANNNGLSTNQNSNSSDVSSKLGISQQSYQEFKSYFGIENATVKLNQTRTWMTVDIKAGSLAKLLQTDFVLHKLNNRSFYTPDPNHLPKVPSQIASQILSMNGLDDYSQPAQPGGAFIPATSALSAATSQKQNANVDCSDATNKSDWNGPILFPSDYIQSYGLSAFQQKGWYGQNQKVLLVEPDDAYNQNDVDAFFNCENFRGTLSTVTVDGAPPQPTGFFDESTLDIDVIASMAPQAQIVDYQGDSQGAYARGEDAFVVINDLLQRIIDDYRNNTHSGAVISMSFGGDESELSQSDLTMINQSLQILTNVEHITVFSASGDCGAFQSGTYGQLGVNFPASDPWVVATGGTILQTNSNGQRTSEVAWSDSTAKHDSCNNSWGSGGGVSTAFQEPAWQQQNASSIPGLHNQYSTGYRQLPDLAAAATNILCYMQNQWGDCSGTSAATPLVASGMAVMNGAFISNFKCYFYGPGILYGVQSRSAKDHPFNNIVKGNDLYYQAGNGWNYPTGLGSPNFASYYEGLQAFLPHS